MNLKGPNAFDFLVMFINFSGHCMMEEDKLTSPKTFSAATSPIKDSIKHGSRELAKKLISRDVQTEKYAGFNSSSSSEKVNILILFIFLSYIRGPHKSYCPN